MRRFSGTCPEIRRSEPFVRQTGGAPRAGAFFRTCIPGQSQLNAGPLGGRLRCRKTCRRYQLNVAQNSLTENLKSFRRLLNVPETRFPGYSTASSSSASGGFKMLSRSKKNGRLGRPWPEYRFRWNFAGVIMGSSSVAMLIRAGGLGARQVYRLARRVRGRYPLRRGGMWTGFIEAFYGPDNSGLGTC